MMRTAARVDVNQAEIVNDLRSIGASVLSMASIGRGCPDLLVGFGGRNYLFEVKDPKKPPSRRLLRPEQVNWHACWSGHVCVVETFADCLRALGQG
jgi:Holliday junction resolvase